MKGEASIFFLKFTSQATSHTEMFFNENFLDEAQSTYFKRMIINLINEIKGFKEDIKNDSVGLKRKNLKRVSA